MMKKNRKKLNKKYIDFPVLHFKEQTKNNYIQFYTDHINLLNELKKELYEIKKQTKIEECTYNYRQEGCIKRLYIEDSGWKEENNKYRQRIKELIDFIYYNDELDYEDNYLTKKEINELLKMIEYLEDLAKERLNYWEKLCDSNK